MDSLPTDRQVCGFNFYCKGCKEFRKEHEEYLIQKTIVLAQRIKFYSMHLIKLKQTKMKTVNFKMIILCCSLLASINTMQAQLSGYRITGARVTIKTGNDNKEYNAKAEVYLFPTASATYSYVQAFGQKNLSNEMKVNSSTEIGLTTLTKQRIPWPVLNDQSIPKKANRTFTSGSANWLLEDLQKQGFRLLIAYRPAVGFDAWKINQVTVKLEIKKSDGSPHPTLNNKTIVFSIASPALGAFSGRTLVCEADKNLVPATHYLSNNICIE